MSLKASSDNSSSKEGTRRRRSNKMGVVKDGTISGFLPSNQVFGVHYPSTMSRAIDTLGGTQTILKAHISASNNNNRLELRFRHDDPYSRPAFGVLRPCNSYLLKISTSKSDGAPLQPQTDLPTPQAGQFNLSADIVARVPEAYHFDGMADYQHVIAVHADVARKRKRSRAETEEPHADSGGLMDIDQEDLMILLPQFFAPKDVPDNLVLLSRVAYYFSRGPFLRFWIKKGFDPRKDPDSRIYQKINYRVKPPLQGYCEANSANQLKHKWSDLCSFRVFPFKFHTTLQLFELDDDYIQEQIKKAPAQTACSPETGWFSYNLLENLKYRVQMRFLSVYPKPGAERLLKAATESFKKSKKICNKGNLVCDEMVQQQTIAGNEDAEEPNNVEDDEEDDIEVDNGEEALDTYGGHDLVEDDEISLQPHSYLDMENVSRIHLQELFGSFPSPEVVGDTIQHSYNSDEECQIYEEDTDGNFSDEN